jgi:hypothetical protein
MKKVLNTFETAPFVGGILSGIKGGVAFLVLSGQLNFCKKLLADKGLSKLILD